MDPERAASLEWLERDSAQSLAWQAEQDAATVAAVRAWPDRAALRRGLERLVAPVDFPRPAGDRWFAVSTIDGETALTVRDDPRGDERVVLRPGRASLDWHFPSPDGRLIAVGLSEGGDEQSVLRVVETDTARMLPEAIPFASFAGVAWLPDAGGFYYSAGTAPDTEDARKHIWLHRIGHAPPTAPEPVPSRVPFCIPIISADGRYVACQPSEVEPRPDYLLDRAGDGVWRPFLRDLDGTFAGFFDGDRFVAATSDSAPRGRVVSIPIATPTDRSTWAELVPESDAVLRGVVPVDGRMVVVSLVDASCRIAVHALDGTLVAPIPLPDDVIGLDHGAWLFEPPVAASAMSFSFVTSTPTSSGVAHVYDVAERRLTALNEPASRLAGARVTRIRASQAHARAWVVHSADLDLDALDGPVPALLHGYGGWNAAYMPVWPGAMAAIVEAGGVLALANLCGGGELGDDFWRHGRREHKQRSYDDLFAVAEELIARGITAPDRLAVAGASNGGLLAAAAVTQRPDLWRAVASIVPVTDLLGFARDSHVAQGIEELGDPADPRTAETLAGCSPCHRVADGVAYPATLVACAAHDVRCPPWHSRKLVAAMQHATSGDAPIRLRVWDDATHMSHVADVDQAADWLGFVMDEIGLSPAR
jgi:prolyl oligopeptidase